jgi:hypothetical protein
MVVAKSNRRMRQDRVKAGAKRAEQARRRAKAEREQQTAERYRCLLDPRTSPADVAGILAAELPDSLAAGAMMQIRLSSGVPGEEIAQTARLMLASATGPRAAVGGAAGAATGSGVVTGDQELEVVHRAGGRSAREEGLVGRAVGGVGQHLRAVDRVRRTAAAPRPGSPPGPSGHPVLNPRSIY